MASSTYAESILRSLRRIGRALDQHSRRLTVRYQLTAPQVVCLQALRRIGPITPGALAREVSASQATVTGILDRLEARGLVRRDRDPVDRRRVVLTLTDAGRAVAEAAPSALQSAFESHLDRLPAEEQEALDAALRRVVEMMESEELAPAEATGDLPGAPALEGGLDPAEAPPLSDPTKGEV